MEEYEAMVDEFTNYLWKNKRSISVKDFRIFLDEIGTVFNNLKKKVGGVL